MPAYFLASEYFSAILDFKTRGNKVGGQKKFYLGVVDKQEEGGGGERRNLLNFTPSIPVRPLLLKSTGERLRSTNTNSTRVPSIKTPGLYAR